MAYAIFVKGEKWKYRYTERGTPVQFNSSFDAADWLSNKQMICRAYRPHQLIQVDTMSRLEDLMEIGAKRIDATIEAVIEKNESEWETGKTLELQPFLDKHLAGLPDYADIPSMEDRQTMAASQPT